MGCLDGQHFPSTGLTAGINRHFHGCSTADFSSAARGGKGLLLALLSYGERSAADTDDRLPSSSVSGFVPDAGYPNIRADREWGVLRKENEVQPCTKQ